ncbi:virion structural protein [Rhodobacteraceae phage LS06-2018-MD05]|nr:virion structural protein [Rhodobacteraceae phage LS06-2018-MD05]
MSIRAVLNSVNGEHISKDDFFSWNEIQNSISRSSKYYGVIISQSLELTFIGSTYDYLLDLDNTYDVAAVCTVVIQYFNNNTGGWDDGFSGLIDFTTKKQSDNSGNQITYNAYSDDFANKILERGNIKIPYDRLETLDGETITPFANEYESVSIIGMEIADNNVNSVITDFDYNYDSTYRRAVLKVVNDITNPSYQDVSPRTYSGQITSNIISSDCWYYAKIKSQISFDYSLIYEWKNTNDVFSADSNSQMTIELYKGVFVDEAISETPTALASFNYSPSGSTSPGDIIKSGTFSGSLNVSLDVNEGIFFNVYAVGTDAVGIADTRFTVKENSTIISNFSQLSDPTDCNFVKPIHAVGRTVHSITGIEDCIASDYFETGDGSTLFLTNGKLIRQYPVGWEQEDDNQVTQLTFSLENWFDNFNKIRNIGAGVEDGKLRIEQRSFFYQDDVILEIGKDIEIKSFERTRDLTNYYSVIKSGYEYDNIEELGVLQEYNSNIETSSPIIKENELNLISKYIGSGYAIEITRSKIYDETSTTDFKFDNNIFFFNVYDDSGTWIQRTTEGFAEINGIDLISTPINLIITPNRNIRKHGWLINEGLKGYSGGVLKYNNSEITTNLETRLDTESEVIRENDPININDLDSAIFSGEIDSFSAPVGSSTFNLLKNNPYKVIKYWNPLLQDYSYGNIEEVSTSPIDKKTNWKIRVRKEFSESGSFILLQDGSYILLEDGGRILLEN